MQYNPSTEGYWSETWSDKQFAQHEWAGSTWYRQSQGMPHVSLHVDFKNDRIFQFNKVFYLVIFATMYIWLETEKSNFGPGKSQKRVKTF